jgi:tellurite methyltransferase
VSAPEGFDTAHRWWDRWWSDAQGRAQWAEPEPAVLDTCTALRARGASDVLDLGAGIGRHSLAFAAAGLRVTAADASTEGTGVLRDAATRADLAISTVVAGFAAVPLRSASVDHVLAWNVLYHGDGALVAAALQECRRVLRPGGTLHLTMLSKHHRAFAVGHEIAPDTFVDPRSKGDKEHPHFYVDEPSLTTLLTGAGFGLHSLADVDQHPPDGFHLVALAQAR